MKRFSYDERDYAYGQSMLTLRTTMGLTQAGLADVLGISRRAVAEWEAGSSYPKIDHLKGFITLAVQQQAFVPGREAEEIRKLWKAARQKVLLDESWLVALLSQQSMAEHASVPPPGTLSPGLSQTVSIGTLNASTVTSLFESARTTFYNLPARVTSLIGRETELQAVGVLLSRSDIRLLTMTGTGGIGKTSLALACASEMVPTFRNGACFVELASITNPDQVLPALIQTLEIKELHDLPPIASLKRVLHDKHLLLVLDNFEHVLDAAPSLLELLQSCPELKMLVTSRAVLHVPGEYTFPVPSLAVPDLKQIRETNLITNASIALFMERARAHKPDFQLTAVNASALVKLCRQLDGLPLALELAAARITHLSPQQLLARLARSLDLLVRPGNVAPTRQQTMRQAIQWSYDLLTPQEQLLLCRLSVFVGGCSLTDVEALYTHLGDDPFWVLDGVASLTNKSLIVQKERDDAELRLDQLEIIREFSREILVASGELERTRMAHAQHYASLVPVPSLAQFLIQGEQLAQVKRDYQNILAALHFFLEQQNLVQALQMAVGMGGTWVANGYGSGGRQEMEHILTHCLPDQAPISATLFAMALTSAGRICINSADFLQAVHWYRKGLSLWRTLPEKGFLAMTLAGLGFAEFNLGHLAEGHALYEESITLLRHSAEPGTLARVLIGPGLLALHQGRLDRAQTVGEEGVQLARAAGGQQWALGSMLHILGSVKYLQRDFSSAHAFGQEGVALLRKVGFPIPGLEALCTFAYATAALGDQATAQALFEEALTLAQEAGDAAETGRAWCGLGYLAFYQHDVTKARLLFEESFSVMHSIKPVSRLFTNILASSLEGLAATDLMNRHFVRVARLLGAADTLRHIEEYTDPLGKEIPLWENTRAEALHALGATVFTRAFTEGSCMTPMQAFITQEPK